MRIVVIGAGLLGVTTAYFLARSGHKVTVIDRRDGPGLETSFANGGMLTPSQAAPWNTPGISLKLLKWFGRTESPLLLRPAALFSILGWGAAFLYHSAPARFMLNQRKNALLAGYSLRILRQLRDELDIHYDETLNGTMKIYRTHGAFKEARTWFDTLKENVHFEVLDNAGVIRREPALAAVADKIAGGIYYPGDEAGDAYKFCREMAHIASVKGVSFRYGTLVKGLLRSGNLISAVHTPAGEFEADVFVLAAGSYSRVLAKSAGISLPINPVKGYSLTLSCDPGDPMPVVPVIDESRHIAITPLGNRIRIAGMAELAGYDTTIDDHRIDMMLAFFCELYPQQKWNADPAAGGSWAGLRPYTSDGVPVMGPSPVENLYLNTGHGHLGWSMAAGSARLVADLIISGKTEVDLVPYQLDRFRL